MRNQRVRDRLRTSARDRPANGVSSGAKQHTKGRAERFVQAQKRVHSQAREERFCARLFEAKIRDRIRRDQYFGN
jgi:hypothetical protein